MRNGGCSFWLTGAGHPVPPRTEVLADDLDVDVAIIGAGVSGLWTAWALANAGDLSIAVLEADTVGSGASGRNGGMLSAKPVGLRKVLSSGPGGREAVIATEDLVRQSMHEVVEVLGAETIDARHGGWLQVARSDSEQGRLDDLLKTSRSWGLGEDRLRAISAQEAYARVRITNLTGAVFSPDNYSLNPAKMMFELARITQDAGVRIFEHTRVETIAPHKLTVGRHVITARTIVVATEAYTILLPGEKRRMVPLNSSMVVSEPLPASAWEQLGWEDYESVAGTVHARWYMKRTEDDRVAMGGPGLRYRFGSQLDNSGRVDAGTVTAIMSVFPEIFPQVEVRPAHAWCGVMGLPRDWTPFVDHDQDTGILRVGGWVGYGLSAARLGGLIAADLVTGRTTARSSLPWVRPAPRRWEPEPFRWIGANSVYSAYSLADRLEDRSGGERTSWVARAADKVAGL